MSQHELNNSAFLDCVSPLLQSREVNEMKRWRHHFSVTCYEHSLFVSYVAFRLARRLGWDYKAAARAGLLHDLYLYDPADRSAHPGNQCLDHPVAALRNARTLCPDLSEREANAIFTLFAPYDDPEIVISIVVEGGASGGNLAQAAGEIVNYYFSAEHTVESVDAENTLLR